VRFLRESLAEVLPREGRLLIAGLFSNPQEALRGIVELQPDIVLLDEAFPDGPAVVGQIRYIAPPVLVVTIAVAETPEEVVAWAEAGAAGYIPSTASLADMCRLLVEITRGEQACSPSVAAALLRRLSNGVATKSRSHGSTSLPMLTAREEQIAEMIVAGLSNKDIARRLDIGLATAKTHVHHLLGKLGLQRRGQAASWMREHRQ
jgi:two-component system, NarL family, nitrate/nitrite response regulator NarL